MTIKVYPDKKKQKGYFMIGLFFGLILFVGLGNRPTPRKFLI